MQKGISYLLHITGNKYTHIQHETFMGSSCLTYYGIGSDIDPSIGDVFNRRGTLWIQGPTTRTGVKVESLLISLTTVHLREVNIRGQSISQHFNLQVEPKPGHIGYMYLLLMMR